LTSRYVFKDEYCATASGKLQNQADNSDGVRPKQRIKAAVKMTALTG
jgi:hypothetical protein